MARELCVDIVFLPDLIKDKSINAQTGALADSLNLGWGAILSADNRLYYYNQGGKLFLLAFNDDGKMTQEGELKISRGTKEHFSHPVIKNGILYQRRGQALMAFDIKARP